MPPFSSMIDSGASSMTHKGMMNRCFVLLLAVFTFGRLLAGEPATAIATITAGFVTGITVTSGGSGYTVEPKVTLSGGGGSGASAKAILAGDKVAVVVVLTSGNRYTSAPTVVLEGPPKALGVRMRLVPELTVEAPAGSVAQVQSAESLTGPWASWTNVMVGAEGTVLVDLSPGSAARFYRAVADKVWLVPDGMALIPAGQFQMGDARVGGAVGSSLLSASSSSSQDREATWRFLVPTRIDPRRRQQLLQWS